VSGGRGRTADVPGDAEARVTGAGDPRDAGDPQAVADPTTEALAPLRERIDTIDHEIVALLNERAEIALEIGRIKEATGRRAIRDPKREAEVIERVTSASSGLFPEPELVSLYRTLIAATRKVQAEQRRRAKVAGPDPEG
jgi:chorismate mutase/prephenate dehydratase